MIKADTKLLSIGEMGMTAVGTRIFKVEVRRFYG
jgi:hypothetical protein